MQQTTEKLDLWAVVELFGHSKIAGRCTEQNIADTNMLRVDVPETTHNPAFTRLIGSQAIYAIHPMDEASVRFHAEQLEKTPMQSWDVKAMLKKNGHLALAAATASQEDTSHDDDLLGDLPY